MAKFFSKEEFHNRTIKQFAQDAESFVSCKEADKSPYVFIAGSPVLRIVSSKSDITLNEINVDDVSSFLERTRYAYVNYRK